MRMNKVLFAMLVAVAAFVSGCASHHPQPPPASTKIETNPQKITPFLWFDGKAEEAAKFYTSVFKHARIVTSNPMMATFELEGVEFMALNAGPQFKFTEAISFNVNCETQEEIDYFWEKLTADGGEPGPCGWLKDKFGLSWQVAPAKVGDWITDPDKAKSARVFRAYNTMGKIEIAALEKAFAG